MILFWVAKLLFFAYVGLHFRKFEKPCPKQSAHMCVQLNIFK